MREQIQDAITLLKKQDVDGCITGSCLLDYFEGQDIDLFTYSKSSFISVVQKLIKSTKLIAQTDITRYELDLLENLLPQPIDLEKEFNWYLHNATSDKSIGGVMKYFKEEFPGRYDAKELSIMARSKFRKNEPKLKKNGKKI